jgi:hypothetical protein
MCSFAKRSMIMTTIQKIKVQPTWDIKQIREKAACIAVTDLSTALVEMAKHGPEAVKHYQEAWTTNCKIEGARKHNVKTPMDLVKYLAEFEVNVFGSEIEMWGDEKIASYTYISCGCFNVCQAHGIMKPEMSEMFENFFKTSTEYMAKELGFKVEVKRETKESFPIFTFTK